MKYLHYKFFTYTKHDYLPDEIRYEVSEDIYIGGLFQITLRTFILFQDRLKILSPIEKWEWGDYHAISKASKILWALADLEHQFKQKTNIELLFYNPIPNVSIKEEKFRDYCTRYSIPSDRMASNRALDIACPLSKLITDESTLPGYLQTDERMIYRLSLWSSS